MQHGRLRFLLLVSVGLNIAGLLTVLRHVRDYSSSSDSAPASSPSSRTSSGRTTPSSDVSYVSSLLKDFSCGVASESVYPFLNLPVPPGERRVVVDIGLLDGKETQAAVAAGYVVYAFEPKSSHMAMTRRALAERALSYYDVPVRVVRGSSSDGEELTIDWGGFASLPQPPLPESVDASRRGIAYLFPVAVGREIKTAVISGRSGGASIVADPGSSRGEKEDIIVAPLDLFVDEDVYFFKTDTQGYELETLRGARKLFQKRSVRRLSTELWPKGLVAAGASVAEMLDFLVLELGMTCFDARQRPPGVDPNKVWITEAGHAEDRWGYVNVTESLWHQTAHGVWGFFEDVMCVCDYWCERRRREGLG